MLKTGLEAICLSMDLSTSTYKTICSMEQKFQDPGVELSLPGTFAPWKFAPWNLGSHQ